MKQNSNGCKAVEAVYRWMLFSSHPVGLRVVFDRPTFDNERL